jgi:hypothetical protein
MSTAPKPLLTMARWLLAKVSVQILQVGVLAKPALSGPVPPFIDECGFPNGTLSHLPHLVHLALRGW